MRKSFSRGSALPEIWMISTRVGGTDGLISDYSSEKDITSATRTRLFRKVHSLEVRPRYSDQFRRKIYSGRLNETHPVRATIQCNKTCESGYKPMGPQIECGCPEQTENGFPSDLSARMGR
jgi:hypothetical protein